MSCPICDHAMQCLIAPWFWCPRCGTVYMDGDEDSDMADTPRLVGRVRQFAANLDTERLQQEWVRLGIEESIER